MFRRNMDILVPYRFIFFSKKITEENFLCMWITFFDKILFNNTDDDVKQKMFGSYTAHTPHAFSTCMYMCVCMCTLSYMKFICKFHIQKNIPLFYMKNIEICSFLLRYHNYHLCMCKCVYVRVCTKIFV